MVPYLAEQRSLMDFNLRRSGQAFLETGSFFAKQIHPSFQTEFKLQKVHYRALKKDQEAVLRRHLPQKIFPLFLAVQSLRMDFKQVLHPVLGQHSKNYLMDSQTVIMMLVLQNHLRAYYLERVGS